MQRMAKFSVIFFITVMSAGFVNAQPGIPKLSIADSIKHYSQQTNSANLFTIREIAISGNNKTKESVILRELPFQSGEIYNLSDLVKEFEIARKQLLNTSLFHEVVVALKKFEGNNIDILVAVKERWYLFPVPYIKFVDRNINQWIVE